MLCVLEVYSINCKINQHNKMSSFILQLLNTENSCKDVKNEFARVLNTS